ncbi:MAG: hypothetical protein C3F11_12435 [Methylocystaceae bacterium]|nr:MAG: hypothetical protein C3F11_12435 [Methylocystaceae bacterium]
MSETFIHERRFPADPPLETRSFTMGSRHSGALQDDLQSLREDVSNLASQLTGLFSETSDEISGDVKKRIQKISDNIDDAISQAGAKGREVVRQTGLDGVGETIESSVREHPFTTLAIAVGVGALVGSQLRR